MLSTDGVQFVQEGLVSDCSGPQTLLIQHGQDAIFVILNEIADDGVVEIFNIGPLDALPHIFLLLFTQSQLDEDLLQLLVAVVNDKLFKAVVLWEQQQVKIISPSY